ATNQDIVLTPIPKVTNQFSAASLSPQALQYILQNGSVIDDRLYLITSITPRYTSGAVTGGYRAQDLNMRPSPDLRTVEPIVVLVGDDGYLRECVQVWLELARPFRYTMVVKESDRPRALLQSIAVTPTSPTMSLSTSPTLQATVTATFADGST